MKPKTPQLHKAEEALPEPPTIDWIVEPLFSRPSVNVVVGEGGSKKTYCMLDLMISIATGKDWLGMSVKKMPCLFIDEESGNKRMLRRLHQLLNGHRITKSIPLYYTTLEQFNLRDQTQVKELRKLIEKTKSGFVVIDALADVILGADENSVKDIMPIFSFARTLADETNVSETIIHHMNRSGTYRGSSAIQGTVDMMLGVESKSKESPIVTFESLKERDIKHTKFCANVEFVSEVEVTIKRIEEERDLSKVQSFVFSYCKKHHSSSTSQILSKANGHSPDSVRRAIYDLSQLGFIKRVNPGDKGKPAIYDIVKDDKLEL